MANKWSGVYTPYPALNWYQQFPIRQIDRPLVARKVTDPGLWITNMRNLFFPGEAVCVYFVFVLMCWFQTSIPRLAPHFPYGYDVLDNPA